MNVQERLLRIGVPVAAVLASIGVGFAGVTSAQSATTAASTTSGAQHERGMWGMGQKPGVFGKVTAIDGTTITVSEQRPDQTVATDYTVDASSATVKKASQGSTPADSSVSAIAVGDMVAVRGTVSGTAVTATEIMDGVMGQFGPHGGHGFGRGTRGTVSAVNGNTITITGASGTTYTVDASSAKIGKISTITVGDVQVGDTLDVMGAVSGTNITAKNIMDGVQQAPQQ